MKKFYITRNSDHDDKFLTALLEAGFIEAPNGGQADFFVHDGVRREVLHMIKNRPAFIIPHTPQSWFLWDGLCDIIPTQCNFVAGQAAVDGMKAYGYPHRVEAIGFSRCEVREFKPSKGSDLLFVPSHALDDETYAEPNYIEKVMRVFDFIIANRRAFGKITMCWDARMEGRIASQNRKYGIDYIATNPYKDCSPLVRMMERMESAGLVMSCGTVGCVSVALGKPTVFFSESGVPHTPPNRPAKRSELYLHRLRHPNMAEKMTIEEILGTMKKESEAARLWRIENIGGQFNAEKFVTIVKEGLEAFIPPPASSVADSKNFKCPFCPSKYASLVRRNQNVTFWKCVKCKRTFNTRSRR